MARNAFGLMGRALRLAQIILVVAPAFIIFGYNQAGAGPLATLESFVHNFPQIDTVNTTGALEAKNSLGKGAVIASFQIGALAGALSCTFLSDRLGRRKTIFIGSILTITGQVLQVSAYSLVQFTVGRIILGMGVGQFSVSVPVWQSECSSAKNRGQNVITSGLFMCLGYALCNWVDFAFTKLPDTNTGQWRGPLAVSVFPSLVVLMSVFLLPESPRWLVRVNRLDEASASLAAYKGLSPGDEAIKSEIAGIDLSLEVTSASKGAISEMFSKKDEERLFYRFCLCIVLQFFQQMCGGNLISVYASTIFKSNLGMGSSLSSILAASALTWKFLCCFIAFFAIDRLGRRKLFIISGAGMSACMAALAITTSFDSSNKHASVASAFFIFLFNLFYPIGFLSGNFLYCTEVAPVRLRVAMASISTANHWLWNFVLVMVTPVAIDTIGYQYYIMYAVLSACIPVVVYFFFPETMNRNLELLNHVFRDASSPWEIVSMARNLPQGELTEADLMAHNEGKDECFVEMKENA
ncbi:Major facilitator superfamily domain, general substrate transporter [Penicillium expansum]|uniref:Major facilitator superfamily domain, general substrate transporter n=1 Tax=Penicillium expansum TaxID=27334 RepID=A0A0A2K566_PENEN|nr:Major facilitator superfamily domain, general substrate transporter [Penicillium expansum]KGO62048.1 Major facilitator superfamily domain, general substrate transporter [Penicillium expansum]